MTFPFYRGLLIEYCKCLTDFFPAAVYTFDLVRKDNFIDQALLPVLLQRNLWQSIAYRKNLLVTGHDFGRKEEHFIVFLKKCRFPETSKSI